MRKEAYLKELEALLANLPAEDREEALQFYADYLENAGPEAEEEVLRSLGTPKELAESIHQALYGDNAEGDYTRVHRDVPGTYRAPFSTGGQFSGRVSDRDSENRYKNGTYAGKNAKMPERKGKLNVMQWILLLFLLLCALPVLLPIFGALFGVVIAIAAVLAAILLAVGIGGIALIFGAVILVVAALVKLVFSPLTSLIMLGGSLVMLGIGILGVVIAAWIVAKVIPAVFKGTVNLCSKLFNRGI